MQEISQKYPGTYYSAAEGKCGALHYIKCNVNFSRNSLRKKLMRNSYRKFTGKAA